MPRSRRRYQFRIEWSVNVELTVEAATPEEAVAFVRAELAMRLGEAGGGRWQTDAPHLLPRYRVGGVRGATRVDEKGFPQE